LGFVLMLGISSYLLLSVGLLGNPAETRAEWSDIVVPHQTRSEDNQVPAAAQGSARLL